MAINKKLIHFNKKETFSSELAKGNILPTSIVFIKDTKEIWNRNQFYHCSYTLEELKEIFALKSELYNDTELVNQLTDLKNKIDTMPIIKTMSNSEYSNLADKDSNTVYLIY